MGISNSQQVSVNVVGSSIFGRYPKISLEKTYNMFISDEWIVNYAGFQKVADLLPDGEGRALFHSVRGGFMLSVASSSIYKIGPSLAPFFIGNINTTTGEVFIDENLSNQICIVDGESAWIYNYDANTLTQQTLTFLGNPIIPNYVCYHNTFFLIGSSKDSINPQNWYAFEFDTPNTIKLNTQLSLQTKPDSALAVKRLPGRGNNVVVLGSTVGEVWSQVGGTQNYTRIQSFNIDSGVISVSTIAANEELVCFLAQNENNAPSILVTDGSSARRISTDGIDFLLQTIKHPDQSAAFFYRQDGHLFFQFTFYNPQDNLSLLYDFTIDKFFHVSDDKLNYHPARQVVYFNKKTYFVSLNDASLYQMGTEFTTYNYSLNTHLVGEEIPRIRIPKTIRRDDSSIFRPWMFTFWIEQGIDDLYLLKTEGMICTGLLIDEDDAPLIDEDGTPLIDEDGLCTANTYRPRVDLSFSKNGNQSFSNVVGRELNTLGNYRNQIRWTRGMGQANEFTPQLRFWGFRRFVAQNGILEIVL